MNSLYIEWKEPNIFDELVPRNKPKKLNAEMRLYTVRSYTMENLIAQASATLGLVLGKPDSLVMKSMVGLLFVMAISPLKFKLMSGNGIDEIIDNLSADEIAGSVRIETSQFLKVLASNGISLKAFDWFLDKGVFAIEGDYVTFRGAKIKSAKIISSIS